MKFTPCYILFLLIETTRCFKVESYDSKSKASYEKIITSHDYKDKFYYNKTVFNSILSSLIYHIEILLEKLPHVPQSDKNSSRHKQLDDSKK